MVDVYRNVQVTISGSSDEDVREQVRLHFGFVEKDNNLYYRVQKLALVKLLKKYTNLSLMDAKKVVEFELGEPS